MNDFTRKLELSRDDLVPAAISGTGAGASTKSSVRLAQVVLAGGSGSRLWPMSREQYPKQLIGVLGSDSLLQATVERMRDFSVQEHRTQSRPIIVFHGDADFTVHPSNSTRIVRQFLDDAMPVSVATESGSARGRAYERQVHWGADGRVAVEHWTIKGGRHAWSGVAAGGRLSGAVRSDTCAPAGARTRSAESTS